MIVKADGCRADEECLPTVPFAAALELSTEAVSPLVPGLGLVRIENVFAQNWMELRGAEDFSVRIQANGITEKSFPGERGVRVEIHSMNGAAEYLRGDFWFGRKYRETVNLLKSVRSTNCEDVLSAEGAYARRDLFHGKTFQSLKGDIHCGEELVTGKVVRDVQSPQIFLNEDSSDLYLDPILLDGVFQLMALWGIERGKYPFPVGVNSLELYQPMKAYQGEFSITISIKSAVGQLLSGDVEAVDESGLVAFRIFGLQMWGFEWPRRYHEFQADPFQRTISRPVSPDSQSDWDNQISAEDIHQGLSSHIARYYLSARELKEFEERRSFKDDQNSERSWLLERLVAKDACRGFLKEKYDVTSLHPICLDMIPTEGNMGLQGRRLFQVQASDLADLSSGCPREMAVETEKREKGFAARVVQ
jgi:hypothetical protein